MNNNILIIDDDEFIRKSFERLLKRSFTVFTAENGKLALEIIKEHQIAVVLVEK